MNKKYDVVVWGASGFTGRLVCEYIFKEYTTKGSDLKWAMAGRDHIKLKQIREKFADNTIPILIADSDDTASLNDLTKNTKVVCTTVGPYAKYGSKLVKACINNKAHYCDLAGEVQWMHDMINKHHDSAQNNEVKIVHTCGFDSIPSDMGVYFINRELKKKNLAIKIGIVLSANFSLICFSLIRSLPAIAHFKSLPFVVYSLNIYSQTSLPVNPLAPQTTTSYFLFIFYFLNHSINFSNHFL